MQVLDQLDSIAPVHAMATGLACSAQATAEEPTRGPEQVVAAVGEPATSISKSNCAVPLCRVWACSLEQHGLLLVSQRKPLQLHLVCHHDQEVAVVALLRFHCFLESSTQACRPLTGAAV